jgi:hypothetical protein
MNTYSQLSSDDVEFGEGPSVEQVRIKALPVEETATLEPPVDGSSLSGAITDYIRQYVVLSHSQLTACVLWVLHTHSFGATDTTPYLMVVSAQPQSGKTLLLEVLELLVPRPMLTSGVSQPALFRAIQAERPTILLDEADAVFGSSSEQTEPLRGLLNSGNRRNGSVSRCVKSNGEWETGKFSTFAAKCVGGIDKGRFPDTLISRSVVVRTKRKKPAERVEKFRYRDASNQAAQIRELAEQWGRQVMDALITARPESPSALSDRAADAWEPLLAIADLLGGTWPEDAREAAMTLHQAQERLEDSVQLLLLRATRDVFEQAEDKLPSEELCRRLNKLPDVPWNSWRKGIAPGKLAELLRPFQVVPRTIRLNNQIGRGSTLKGYLRSDFEDEWSRLVSDDQESM